MARPGIDTRDIRSGTYDPVNKDGLPQGEQIKDKTNEHEKAQWGADVRADPLPGSEPVLPEGLMRPGTPPLNPRTGRNKRSQPLLLRAISPYPALFRCRATLAELFFGPVG